MGSSNRFIHYFVLSWLLRGLQPGVSHPEVESCLYTWHPHPISRDDELEISLSYQFWNALENCSRWKIFMFFLSTFV